MDFLRLYLHNILKGLRYFVFLLPPLKYRYRIQSQVVLFLLYLIKHNQFIEHSQYHNTHFFVTNEHFLTFILFEMRLIFINFHIHKTGWGIFFAYSSPSEKLPSYESLPARPKWLSFQHLSNNRMREKSIFLTVLCIIYECYMRCSMFAWRALHPWWKMRRWSFRKAVCQWCTFACVRACEWWSSVCCSRQTIEGMGQVRLKGEKWEERLKSVVFFLQSFAVYPPSPPLWLWAWTNSSIINCVCECARPHVFQPHTYARLYVRERGKYELHEWCLIRTRWVTIDK